MQVNLNKARQGQIELGQQIRQLNKQNAAFMILAQEPLNSDTGLTLQPNSCQTFKVGRKPRAIIYTDNAAHIWYLETLSTPDMSIILVKINNRSTLVISAYLDIKHLT